MEASVVAAGALSPLGTCRFCSEVVLKVPDGVGAYTCRNWPCAFTTSPWLLVVKEPERVYCVAPSLLTVKKPLPFSARSRLLPVVLKSPCENCCWTCESCTPPPICVWLTPAAEVENSSENSELEDLKPVVDALAMLFAVTFRSLCAASRPLSAIPNDMPITP